MNQAMRRVLLVLCWGCLLGIVAAGSGCQGTLVAQSTDDFPHQTGFLSGSVTVDGEARTIWVFVPRNYNPSYRYPAILFLHGLWEAGNGGDRVLNAGLAPVIASYAEEWPFITIFPQSPGKWQGEDKDRIAMAALEFAEQHWSIDSDRVVLAGFSYGGMGVWEIGARHPDRFAALVPISGLSMEQAVERLTHTPVWAFAFKDDPWVHSSNSAYMCQALKQRGGTARLTEFRGNGHDCSELAVTESELVRWMLQQRRSTASLASGSGSLVFPIHASAQ